MAKKIRNFAAILAISAVVGTMLLVLVFLLPVGPMRRNVEKSVGDMLKSGDEIPEDAFSKYLWKSMRMSITCTFIFMRGTGTAIFYT